MQIVERSVYQRQNINKNPPPPPQQKESNQQDQQPQQQNRIEQKSKLYKFCLLFLFIVICIVLFKIIRFQYKQHQEIHNSFRLDDPFDLKIEITKGKTILHSWNVDNLSYNYDEKNFVNNTFAFTKQQIFSQPYPKISVSIRNKRTNQISESIADSLVVNKEKFTLKDINDYYIELEQELQLLEQQEVKKQNKIPHYRSKYFVQLIHDTNSYYKDEIPEVLKDVMKTENNQYHPLLDTKQLYLKPSEYIYQGQIEELLEYNLKLQNGDLIDKDNINYSTTIFFYPYWIKYYTLNYYAEDVLEYFQYLDPSSNDFKEQFMELFLSGMEETENVFLQTTAYFIEIINSFLSVVYLYYIIQYWKSIQTFYAISLEVLPYQLFSLLFYFLTAVYFEVDYQELTQPIVMIFINLWVMSKTLNFQRKADNKFPYYEICYKQQTYIDTTKKIDKEVTYYLRQLILISILILLIICPYVEESIYVVFKNSIQVIDLAVQIPQLYINYKFQSVQHLPKTDILHKFFISVLNIIYVFLKATPIFQKIFFIANTFIFLIYIYQRIYYKGQHQLTVDILFYIYHKQIQFFNIQNQKDDFPNEVQDLTNNIDSNENKEKTD